MDGRAFLTARYSSANGESLKDAIYDSFLPTGPSVPALSRKLFREKLVCLDLWKI